jgi:hypothetical protein
MLLPITKGPLKLDCIYLSQADAQAVAQDGQQQGVVSLLPESHSDSSSNTAAQRLLQEDDVLSYQQHQEQLRSSSSSTAARHSSINSVLNKELHSVASMPTLAAGKDSTGTGQQLLQLLEDNRGDSLTVFGNDNSNNNTNTSITEGSSSTSSSSSGSSSTQWATEATTKSGPMLKFDNIELRDAPVRRGEAAAAARAVLPGDSSDGYYGAAAAAAPAESNADDAPYSSDLALARRSTPTNTNSSSSSSSMYAYTVQQQQQQPQQQLQLLQPTGMEGGCELAIALTPVAAVMRRGTALGRPDTPVPYSHTNSSSSSSSTTSYAKQQQQQQQQQQLLYGGAKATPVRAVVVAAPVAVGAMRHNAATPRPGTPVPHNSTDSSSSSQSTHVAQSAAGNAATAAAAAAAATAAASSANSAVADEAVAMAAAVSLPHPHKGNLQHTAAKLASAVAAAFREKGPPYKVLCRAVYLLYYIITSLR